jgi:hypothetical protein
VWGLIISSKTEGLWEKAAKSLCAEDQTCINFPKAGKLTPVEEALTVARNRRDRCVGKQWKYRKSNGDTIILRDLFEKTVIWINKFKEIGSIAVQFDPVHAALPWAGVCFFLQVRCRHHVRYLDTDDANVGYR